MTCLPIFFTFFLLVLLLPPASTGEPDCPNRCGSVSFSYPFGVGSDCSLEKSFNITCVDSKPYVHNWNSLIEVVEINPTQIRVKYPYVAFKACFDVHSGDRTRRSEWNKFDFSDGQYSLSEGNWLTGIGCDDFLVSDSHVGNATFSDACLSFCSQGNSTGSGHCPKYGDKNSAGEGCCRTPITKGTSVLSVNLLGLTKTWNRTRVFPCSYAFVNEKRSSDENPQYSYSYSVLLQYAIPFMEEEKKPVVRLDWRIGNQNCSEAKWNSSYYACQDNTDCVDFGAGIGGYLCNCSEGYEGNPYLHPGCTVISVPNSIPEPPTAAVSLSKSIAKSGCLDQCGNLSIPFPFGVGSNCALGPSFEIFCNNSTKPPQAYLAILNGSVLTELNSSRVLVNYPTLGFTFDDLTNVTKTVDRSLVMDLSRTQYTLSDENHVTAIGYNVMVVAVVGEGHRSSCAAIKSDISGFKGVGMCPSRTNIYEPGDGCCRASIPRGTAYIEANLTNLGRWPPNDFSFSYAFIDYNENGELLYYPLTTNSSINPETLSSLINWRRPPILALDWRIGRVSCEEARRNSTNFMCPANSQCFDFGANVGGYLCNCSKGYQGNPYLTQGCQDINECADNTANTCYGIENCVNTQGSYSCLCPKGYTGDGRNYGVDCIQRRQFKMMILIGLGSILGFLLLLSMCFWLFRVLKKRKLNIEKEKFFKRNGGLLLQQQTNEGVIGKTKVFPSKELDVATDHFNEVRIIGQGGQGTVYKGMFSDGKIVAVKKSKLVEENQLEQFINEVAILSQINHRNVVKLLGCCLETEVPLLVYEFMPNGTLFDLIHDPSNEFPFTWNIRLKIAADIAGALAYLHYACSIPIYHRDIKSSNILLYEKYVIKVSDFGTSMSVTTDQTHLTTLVKGTFGYLDPEYFQSSQFTEKSDVYSFGVVLVELLTGQRAISMDKTDTNRSLATRFLTCMDENCLDKILDHQIWEVDKKEDVVSVARLAQRCLNLKGKMRPTMKEVAIELESFRMSQDVVKDEFEEVGAFGSKAMTISDSEYTWTSSCKSDHKSSSDSHPLMFTTK